MEFLSGTGLVFLGAATAAVLGFAGSAIGMGRAGQAASGAASEKPELFGKLLILQAMPGTQGIYGLVAAFLILSFSGVLGAGEGFTLSTVAGMLYFFASLPVGLACLVSGIYQGNVASSGIAMIAKKESEVAKAMIFSAMVETWAIFGVIITIILLISIQK